jgi:carbon storage regulator
MLVLSRTLEEEIVIGGNITVKVLEIIGTRVRLGIVAPRDVPVHRREVYDKIEDAVQKKQLEESK